VKPFSFGENWLKYSRLLDDTRVRDAELSIQRLLGRERLDGWSVLDVGCGSGLFSIAAARLGARRILAIDRDEYSVAAARQNVERFLDGERRQAVEIRSADILKPEFGAERFDLVYAWGSLHHTGSMWSAIENASAACGDGSYFAVAIYNTTWFSPAWLRIKKAYNLSPSPVRFAMAAVLASARVIIRAVQLKPPFSTGRAMNVWYDAIDWLGGLPYEYATAEEVSAFMSARGSRLERKIPTRRSGCNEFVFQRVKYNSVANSSGKM
jgi:2-polyprenyl-6-hydroxyphenyl methylase/3-demethylubiquinone-9 3-methyltransferase